MTTINRRSFNTLAALSASLFLSTPAGFAFAAGPEEVKNPLPRRPGRPFRP